MSEVERWLRERRAEVPDPLLERLERNEDAGAPVVDTLVARGLGALREAVARPGRERAAAFHLLAADAYLTYACEAATEAEDPGGALEALLERVGAGPG